MAMPDYGYIQILALGRIWWRCRCEGKSEMYRHLSLNDKFVFVNLEDAIQIEKTKI
jgi:UDP-N-acetylmuramoyl-tripeptide--D-alanyl-D-alanine ligase